MGNDSDDLHLSRSATIPHPLLTICKCLIE